MKKLVGLNFQKWFFVGATVKLTKNNKYTCTCNEFKRNKKTCKHIKKVKAR